MDGGFVAVFDDDDGVEVLVFWCLWEFWSSDDPVAGGEVFVSASGAVALADADLGAHLLVSWR